MMQDRLSRFRFFVLVMVAILIRPSLSLAASQEAEPAISYDGGVLSYTQDARGNRVPDFSYAGYMQGRIPIPNVPVRMIVSPVTGDNTARIQAAIDYVASLTPENPRTGELLESQGTEFKPPANSMNILLLVHQ
jgi:hypothetical protein